MAETYPAGWLDEKIVVPDRPELRHIAGTEMSRRRAAEKLCEASGIPNMDDALVGVDLKGVVELRATQMHSAYLEEQIRTAQGSSELGPGAETGQPQLAQDASGQAIDTQVNAGGKFTAGRPETMDELAARLPK